VGAFFCGWLCPLGAVQEWVRRLGRKIGIFPKAAGLPFSSRGALLVDRALGTLRYGTLALILFATYRSFNLAFSAVDPFYALLHFWTGTAMPAALAVLGLTLLASLFVHRPWCRWLCPYGAVQGLVQKIAPWKIRRDAALCADCGACDRACPMNVAVSSRDAVTDSRCHRCLSCVASCPKPGALRLAVRRAPRAAAPTAARTPRSLSAAALTPRPLPAQARRIAAAIVLAFLAPLAAGTAYRLLGSDRSLPAAGPLLPALEEASLTVTAAQPEEVLQALSGSMSLEQTAELVQVAPEALLQALGLPGGFDLSVKLRDLEEQEPEKTYRWVRARIEALLRGQEFTQASPGPQEPFTRGSYNSGRVQDSGGLT
jgi:ferredoxin